MTLNQYQELAKGTDCRDEKIKMICNGFGLVGELEEYKNTDSDDLENVMKEAGDVMWYCASICNCLDVDLQDICGIGVNSGSLNKPIAEVFKKVYRDNEGIFNNWYKDYILNYINWVIMWNLPYGEENLSEIMQKNIDKLYSRKERGVIKGNGDNR